MPRLVPRVYLSSLQHPRVQPNPYVHQTPRPYYAARNRASLGRATNCARDAERRVARAYCSPLVPPYHEPLRSLAPQVALVLPTPRDALLTALAKAALPPPVIASLDEPQQASLRSPVSLEALTLGLAGGGGGSAAPQPPGLSPRNLACLRALVAAVHVVAGTLGSSWFVVLEHETQITFLPHAVLPRLVRHPLTLVQLLVCRANTD
jgi:hypothetical protein